MIDVKLIKKPKEGRATGSVRYMGTAGAGGRAGEAKHAARADKSDYAEQADYANRSGYASRAAYAEKANDLSEGSPLYDRFLRKDIPDTAQELITFLKGLLLGNGQYGIDENGNAKLGGVEIGDYQNLVSGGVFRRDADGTTYIEADKLYVRMKAYFDSLEIRKTEHTAGSRISSAAHGRIVKTVSVDSGGNVIPEGTSTSVYAMRCYFNADDGEKRITNDYHVGDQVRCQTFNIRAGVYEGVSNRYYWRLCVGKGEETIDGKTYNYIDLSMIDGAVQLTIDGKTYDCVGCQPGVSNDTPAEEDETVQLGSQTDPDRQSAIMENTVGDNAPAYIMLQGIDSYSMEQKDIISLGFDGATGHAYMKVYGDAYIGDRNRSQYVEFKDGKVKVKGMLDVGSRLADGRDVNNLGITQGNILRNSGFTGDYESVELGEDTALEEDTEVYSQALKYWESIDDSEVKVVDCPESSTGKGVTGDDATLRQTIDGGLTTGRAYIFSFKAKPSEDGHNVITVRIGGASEAIFVVSLEENTPRRFDFPFVCTDAEAPLEINIVGDAVLYEPQLMAGNLPMPWTKNHKDNDRALEELAGIRYLLDAIQEGDTQVIGGLILSQILKVGLWRDGKMAKETGGMSGAYNDDNSPFLWGGGDMKQAIYTIAKYNDNPGYQPTVEELANMAKIVITHGGRAILNDVILRGTIFADGGILKNVQSPNGKWRIDEDGNVQFDGRINADSGKIGPFYIAGHNGMELPDSEVVFDQLMAFEDDGRTGLSMLRYLSLSKDLIAFNDPRNNKYAYFGSATYGGLSGGYALLRLGCPDDRALPDATGSFSAAAAIDNGSVVGFRRRTVRVTKDTYLNWTFNNVICLNSDKDITLTLPSEPNDGQDYFIRAGYGHLVTVVTNTNEHYIQKGGTTGGGSDKSEYIPHGDKNAMYLIFDAYGKRWYCSFLT